MWRRLLRYLCHPDTSVFGSLFSATQRKAVPGNRRWLEGRTRDIALLMALSCGTLYMLKPWQKTEDEVVDGFATVTLPVGLQTEDALFGPISGILPIHRGWPLQWMSDTGSRVLSKAQADVLELWKAVPKEHCLLDKPRVTMHQDTLSIRFGLTGNVDATRFMMEMALALSQEPQFKHTIQNTEIKLQQKERGLTSVLKFDCVRGATTLSIQVTIPIGLEEHPEIEIRKKDALTEDDLSVLRLLFQSVSKVASDGALPAAMERFMDNWVQSKPEDGDPFEELETKMREMMERFAFGVIFPDIESGFPERQQNNTHQLQTQKKPLQDTPQHVDPNTAEGWIRRLETMGAVVYRPNPTERLDWGALSGYDSQKRKIEDGLLLPLLHPEVPESIAKRTRKHYSSNRPRGILFEGPPGTGKTTSARLIASQAAVHLIYLPLESILSKWYGESEKLLSEAFKLAEQLDGSIIFFDEIETLGAKRSDEMHEASRRVLSVLLREMDGFDVQKKIIVIGATNRKQDVDPALLSRFDATIPFGLPDKQCRELIFKQYAQQLSDSDIQRLAEQTEGMSGRDIRDICESTERSWASRIVRGEVDREELPGRPQYLQAISDRHLSKRNEN